jgi:hypothetical protein
MKAIRCDHCHSWDGDTDAVGQLVGVVVHGIIVQFIEHKRIREGWV